MVARGRVASRVIASSRAVVESHYGRAKGREGWATIGVGRRETCRLPINDPLSGPRVAGHVSRRRSRSRQPV